MTRTVRDVVTEWLQGYIGHDDQLAGEVDSILRDLRSVLSTGEVWRTTPIEADALQAGDTIADKVGRLWSVREVTTLGDGQHVEALIARGEHQAAKTFDLTTPVPTLLAAQDARALAILERELGATLIEREAA